MITKEEFYSILDTYKTYTKEIDILRKMGIFVEDSDALTSVNKVVFKLFSLHFGKDSCDLIELYLFQEVTVTKEELYDAMFNKALRTHLLNRFFRDKVYV